MKKFCLKTIAFVLISCILCGCGQMTAISDEDEDKIALYSANLIGRFNKNQKRGIVPVVMKEKPEEEEETEESNSSSADFPLNPFDVNAPVSDGGISSLGEILDIPGVSFSYKDTIISQDYGIEDGFLISPQKGNSFVEVTFKVTNTREDAVMCDIRSRGVNFMAQLGDVVSAVDRTMISNDLSTYSGTIAVGETKELTLLFQFPTAYVSDLSGLLVSGVKEGVKYEITL